MASAVKLLPFGGVPTTNPNRPHGCRQAASNFFRAVAKELGLTKDQYTIKYNACGDWGETTFHTDVVYMIANFDVPLDYHLGLMGRTCKDRKDFLGGPNHWLSVQEVSVQSVVNLYRKLTNQTSQNR